MKDFLTVFYFHALPPHPALSEKTPVSFGRFRKNI
jgi:hypothetical protein